ncbi:MAG TPA: oligosaccharide flippase family protein, partial [Pirellulales bacterium]
MLSLFTQQSPQLAIAHVREKLQHSPLARRLAKGAAWSLVGAVSSRLLTVASTAIIVRLLGKEHYGELGMVQSTLMLLGSFAGMGLGITATKHTAEFRSRNPVRVGRLLGLLLVAATISGILMTIGGWTCSDWLANRVLNRGSLVYYLQISSILVVIEAVDGVFSAALAGFEAFSRIARASIYVALLSPLLTVPLVFFFGLYGAVWGLVVSTSLQMILDGVALMRECKSHEVTIRIDRMAFREWPVLVHFALPALAATIVVMPAMWLGNVMLVHSGASYSGLGVVNVVNTFKTLAIYLPTVLLAPTFAVLANVADNPVAVRKTMGYAIGLSALTVLPLALVVTALAKYALCTIYGAEYSSEGAMLACAMIVAAIQATGLGFGAFINATGRMWLGLGINLLFGLAFLILAYVLIPKYGPIGYLAAMAIAYLFTTVITYGGFSLTLPHLMQCYPLTRSLLLFGVLIFPAVYV